MNASTNRTDFPPLPRDFYDRPAEIVARALLGKQLIRSAGRGLVRGRIVEVEAYLASGDPACHAARGRTRKNESMFGRPGIAYVYSIHARWCFNAVTEPERTPSAVLIRALEPLEGLATMGRRRGRPDPLDWTRGPARLCEALAIDKRLDGRDLTTGRAVWIAEDPEFDERSAEVGVSGRIGIREAVDLPLRFYLAGVPYVSGRRNVVRQRAE